MPSNVAARCVHAPAVAGCALNVYGGRVLAASMSGGTYPAINDGISLKSNKLSIFSADEDPTQLTATTVADYTANRKSFAKIVEYVNVIVPQTEHVNVTAVSQDVISGELVQPEGDELAGTGYIRYRFERFDNVFVNLEAQEGYELRSPSEYVFMSIDSDQVIPVEAVVVAPSEPAQLIARQPFSVSPTQDEMGRPCCEVKPIGELGPGERWFWMSCDRALAQKRGVVSVFDDDALTTEEALVQLLNTAIGMPVSYGLSIDMFRFMLPLDRCGVGGADAVIRLPTDTDLVFVGKVYDAGLDMHDLTSRYYSLTMGLATDLTAHFENGEGGHNEVGDEPTDDEIEAILKEAFPEPHEVTQDEDGSFRVTLGEDMIGPVEIPDNLGPITLDMHGFHITGTNSYDGAVGGSAIIITASGDAGGDDTELTLTNSGEHSTEADVRGGDGADGQQAGDGGAAILADTERDVAVNVDGSVQVAGGDGGTTLAGGGVLPPDSEGGLGIAPADLRGERAPGSVRGGASGTAVAVWAKATRHSDYSADEIAPQLPEGVTAVGNELWFWKRTTGEKIGFDFRTIEMSWIYEGEIRFAAGQYLVDQFTLSPDDGIFFVGADGETVATDLGKCTVLVSTDSTVAFSGDDVMPTERHLDNVCPGADRIALHENAIRQIGECRATPRQIV